MFKCLFCFVKISTRKVKISKFSKGFQIFIMPHLNHHFFSILQTLKIIFLFHFSLILRIFFYYIPLSLPLNHYISFLSSLLQNLVSVVPFSQSSYNVSEYFFLFYC